MQMWKSGNYIFVEVLLQLSLGAETLSQSQEGSLCWMTLWLLITPTPSLWLGDWVDSTSVMCPTTNHPSSQLASQCKVRDVCVKQGERKACMQHVSHKVSSQYSVISSLQLLQLPLTSRQSRKVPLVFKFLGPHPLHWGITAGYKIYYSGGSSGSVDVSGGSTHNHLLTHLESGTTYTIVIVGTSEHFFSEEVENPNSITLSI